MSHLFLPKVQLSRQVGNVMDGEAQCFNLGQHLSSGSHWWRQVGPEMMQCFGQVPHPELLPFACTLALQPRELWPWSSGPFGHLAIFLLILITVVLQREDLWKALLSCSIVESWWRETAGISGRCWREAAAGAVVAGVRSREALLQEALTIDQKLWVILKLDKRARDIHGYLEWGKAVSLTDAGAVWISCIYPP